MSGGKKRLQFWGGSENIEAVDHVKAKITSDSPIRHALTVDLANRTDLQYDISFNTTTFSYTCDSLAHHIDIFSYCLVNYIKQGFFRGCYYAQ